MARGTIPDVVDEPCPPQFVEMAGQIPAHGVNCPETIGRVRRRFRGGTRRFRDGFEEVVGTVRTAVREQCFDHGLSGFTRLLDDLLFWFLGRTHKQTISHFPPSRVPGKFLANAHQIGPSSEKQDRDPSPRSLF